MPSKRSIEGERVHNRIAVLRAERGMTRHQLAAELGVHYQTVGYVERGEYSPSLALALRTARVFDLPVEAVFSTEPFEALSAQVYRAQGHGTPTSRGRPGGTAPAHGTDQTTSAALPGGPA